MSAPPSRNRQLLLLVVAFAIMQALPGALWRLAEQAGWIGAEAAMAWGMAGFGIAGLAIAWLGVRWPPLPWRPVQARGVLLVYLPFALLWLLFLFGYLRAMHALDHTVPPQWQLQQLAGQGTALPGFWIIVAVPVVVAPLAEEVLFRGYLLGALLATVPAPLAQLATAAAFGCVHPGGYELPIGLLGLLFGWLRTRYGALWPSVLAHAVHNGLTVAVTLLWPGHLELLYPR